MQNRTTFLLMLCFLMLCTVATKAQAVNWGNAPLACLPDRVVVWKNGTQPELCHCPPQSMCPQSSTIKPAAVDFKVDLIFAADQANSHTVQSSFTISGPDLANYYNSSVPATFNFTNSPSLSFTTPGFPQNNAPYTPFDPTQIFVMQDNSSNICPEGWRPKNGNNHNGYLNGATWGAIQDYIAPVVRQYLIQNNINYNLENNGFDNLCSMYDGIKQYNVTVTVSNSLATQISQATQMPPSFVKSCCPQSTFNCPTNMQVQVGQSNSASCQETVQGNRLGCLLEGTPVLLSNGKDKKVDDIKLGERLKGEQGTVTVVAINKFTQSADEMYGFNGSPAFITSEHPILTKRGWKAINPQLTTVKSGIGNIGQLNIGDNIITRTGTLKITSIEKHTIHTPATAYNFAVKGGDGFIANDVVVKGFSQVEIHY